MARALPTPDQRCAAIARQQHGVFSRNQALSAGHSSSGLRRRLASGRWESVFPRVYRFAGTPPTWEQSLMAACLHAGKEAAASHRAAAALWRLDAIDDRVLEIVHPRRVRIPEVVAHETTVSRRSITHFGLIPVTDPTRTLLDLGAVVPPRLVEQALDDALRRRLTSLHRIRRLLDRAGGKGRPGVGVLRGLLLDRDPRSAPPESVLETRLARLLTESGLPPPTPQHEVRVGGRLVARVDFAWPDAMVAVEADGYRYHSGGRAWHRDRARSNALTGLDWRIFHVTWDDVDRRPEATIAMIRAALLPSLSAASRR